jgi:hypothetical protein
MTGIVESSAHSTASLGKGADAYPHAVARALFTWRKVFSFRVTEPDAALILTEG